MHDHLTLRTPENVPFRVQVAGLGSRAIAWALDLVVMGCVLVLASMLAQLLGLVLSGFASALYFVLAFAVQWGYGALCEALLSGQTLGKRVVGLRVLQSSGLPLTPLQAVLRNLLRIVDLVPGLYFVGGVTALLDLQGRRLGDLAAGTVVVHVRRAARPSAFVAPAERHNTFLHDPNVIAAMARITAPERDAMLGLALRRETLPLTVRHALFAKLARHLEARLGLARPTYFSDERFVLNLAALTVGASERAGGAVQTAPAPFS